MIPPAYVRRADETAGPPRHARLLLVMLEGGHACLVRARAALGAGDLRGFASDVCRTQAALLEAASAVDPAADGPLAARIDELHDAMVGSLALATDAPWRASTRSSRRSILFHDCRTLGRSARLSGAPGARSMRWPGEQNRTVRRKLLPVPPSGARRALARLAGGSVWGESGLTDEHFSELL
jgi:hypothetical protein